MRLMLLILTVTLLTSCLASGRGRSLVDKDADLTKYKKAVIYNSSTAAFIELELMQIFREAGYQILGESEVVKKVDNEITVLSDAIGVRYSASEGRTEYILTCTIEDMKTSKSLATIEGIGSDYDAMWGYRRPNRESAIRKFKNELEKILLGDAYVPKEMPNKSRRGKK